MSSKHHKKQVARSRQKRQSAKFERRAARNRVIIFIMAGLMVLSLFTVVLTDLIAGRGDASPPPPPETDPVAGQSEEPDAGEDAAADGSDDASADQVSYDAPFELTIDPDASYTATIVTNQGEVTVELDAAGAPQATNNLVNLAEDGYYDGVIFHRVIEGFMIQGGDPTGTGSGGPGYRFDDELDPAIELTEAEGGYPRGTLAMANAGANTNGSQFFIIHQDYPLPPQYTVFGRVVDGMDVVDAIATTPTDSGDRPLEQMTIETVTIDQS